MRNGLVGAAGVVLCLWAWAQPVDLRAVEPLQTPVSLRLVMRPLREAIQQIAAQTGAALGIAKAIEQYKITLIAHQQPAWQTLELLAQVYGLEWRAESAERYYLVAPEATRAQQQRQQRAQLEALQRALEERLQTYQRATATDFARLHQRIAELDAERSQLEQQQPPNWIERAQQLATARAQIGAAGESLPLYLLGVLSRSWTREQRARLLNGQPLLASTQPLGDALPLPADTLRWLTVWNPSFAEVPLQSAQMLVRLNLQRKTLELALVARAGEQVFPFVETVPLSLAEPEEPPAIEAIPETLAKQPLHFKASSPAVPSPYWGKQYTLAEQLAWLAEHTNLNIVADSFRLPVANRELSRNAPTLGTWLRDVQTQEPVRVRFPAEGWLMVQHQHQAELLASEIDEPTLERFEARAQNGLDLDDYAELAYLLTPAQQARLEQPNRYALRFDPTPLQAGIPALRFWASLTPAQRQAARERQPLYYPQLSALQQRLLWEAVEHALLHPTIQSGDLLLHLDRLYDPYAQAELAFFLDFWRNIAFEVRDGDVTLVFEDVESYEQTLQALRAQGANPSVQREVRTNYSFYFGFDTRHAAIYPVSIQQRAETPPTAE